jgi:uncharacterized protein
MGTLRNLVDENRQEILELARSNKAVGIMIFGSVARSEDVDGSDVAFLVDMEEGASLFDLGGLQFELSNLLGVDVDVVTRGSLKPRDTHVLADAVSL